MDFDFTDIYISFPGLPSYNDTEMVQDDTIRVIIQKVEMILYTNKGELLGNPEFGADLYRLLFSTNVNAGYIHEEISRQFNEYIPELISIGYSLNVSFAQNPNEFSDMMFIDIKINKYEVNAYFA